MLFQLLQAEGLDTVMAETMTNAAAAAQAAPQQVEQTYSLIQMASKGGFLMIVLAILSDFAIYIFG